MTDEYLYSITLGCPNCDETTRVVESRDEPVALDTDVPLSGYPYCPRCGIHLPTIGVEWDLRAEHEIETVEPTTDELAPLDVADFAAVARFEYERGGSEYGLDAETCRELSFELQNAARDADDEKASELLQSFGRSLEGVAKRNEDPA